MSKSFSRVHTLTGPQYSVITLTKLASFPCGWNPSVYFQYGLWPRHSKVFRCLGLDLKRGLWGPKIEGQQSILYCACVRLLLSGNQNPVLGTCSISNTWDLSQKRIQSSQDCEMEATKGIRLSAGLY